VLVERPAEEAFRPAKNGFLAQLLGLFAGAALSIAILIWAARRLDSAVQEQSAAYEIERSTREELQRAVARLEEREALRDAFVGVMSHELRTPVTTIYGAAKLLAKGPGREDGESLIADIEEESDRLRRITEDLLVLSRAQHGAVEVHPEPVLVQRLTATVATDILRRFPDAHVALDLAGDLPPVSGDPGALRQVLNNLLTNAVKYGDGAPIRVRAEAHDTRSVQVCVEDLGPGVPASELAQLFDLFYRSPHNARKAAGTGIGLYVVRQLVEAMGGRVHAYAVEPHGVGFAMTLPIYASDEAPEPEPLEREVAALARQ
jgi:signal transduction histidine kinase